MPRFLEYYLNGFSPQDIRKQTVLKQALKTFYHNPSGFNPYKEL